MSERRFNPDNYVTVQERINLFWIKYPDGSIVTRLMSPPDNFDACRYEATVYTHRDDVRPTATGYAFEVAGGHGPNSTNHEENCETSAIGRALANLGFAKTADGRPSREEVRKVANAPQKPPQRPTVAPQPPRPIAGPSQPPAEPVQTMTVIEHERLDRARRTAFQVATNRKISDGAMKALCRFRYGVASRKEMTAPQWADLATFMGQSTDLVIAEGLRQADWSGDPVGADPSLPPPTPEQVANNALQWRTTIDATTTVEACEQAVESLRQAIEAWPAYYDDETKQELREVVVEHRKWLSEQSEEGYT